VVALNIGGIAPLIILTLPGAGIAVLNTVVLWKKTAAKKPAPR
jgi:hypothetical protein